MLVFALSEICVAFVHLKIDITQRNRTRLITLKNHISLTVIYIVFSVGLGKPSASRIHTRYKTSGSSYQKEEVNVE